MDLIFVIWPLDGNVELLCVIRYLCVGQTQISSKPLEPHAFDHEFTLLRYLIHI